MTHDDNCCKDFSQFRHSQVVKNSFSLHFTIFFVVNSSDKLFLEAFTCLIQSNLTKIVKTNENKFSLTLSMYLYSNRSWATTNHSARSIHIILWKEIERMTIVKGNYLTDGDLHMRKSIIACPLFGVKFESNIGTQELCCRGL